MDYDVFMKVTEYRQICGGTTKLSLYIFYILFCIVSGCSDSKPSLKEGWRVFALEYGQSNGFRRSALVHGAKRGERQPISWMVWLLQGYGKNVLVDTGFEQRSVAKKWKFSRFEPVPKLLGRLNVDPKQITDVILTHCHWDHIGFTQPYSRAVFWLQKEELAWAKDQVNEERPTKAGVRLKDLEAIADLNDNGRVRLITGDTAIAPGVLTHVGGRHTRGIQWIEIQTRGSVGTVALASDIAYLFENIETLTPPGSSLDPNKDLETIQKMIETASQRRFIIPGHDPEVFRRFPVVKPGIAEISLIKTHK